MNNIVCKNCSEPNPYYELICRKCKAYIRDRVVNIDLWQTVSLLIESPARAYTGIIHAEHKNFITFILILSSLKLLFDVMMVSLFSAGSDNPFNHFFVNYLVVAGLLILLTVLVSWSFKLILRQSGTETRFRDNLSIIIYSMIPHVFGLILIFPIEMVIFGGFLFSNNPSPFILKPNVAYVMAGFETLLILWQVFLTTAALFTASRNIILTIIFSAVFNCLLYFILYTYSYLFF